MHQVGRPDHHHHSQQQKTAHHNAGPARIEPVDQGPGHQQMAHDPAGVPAIVEMIRAGEINQVPAVELQQAAQAYGQQRSPAEAPAEAPGVAGHQGGAGRQGPQRQKPGGQPQVHKGTIRKPCTHRADQVVGRLVGRCLQPADILPVVGDQT